MITALKNKIDRLADEGMTRFDEMDTDKMIECQRHLSFIHALTQTNVVVVVVVARDPEHATCLQNMNPKRV